MSYIFFAFKTINTDIMRFLFIYKLFICNQIFREYSYSLYQAYYWSTGHNISIEQMDRFCWSSLILTQNPNIHIIIRFSTRDRSVGSKGFSISRESDFNVSARVLIFNLARKPKSEVIYKTQHILSPYVKLFRHLTGVW